MTPVSPFAPMTPVSPFAPRLPEVPSVEQQLGDQVVVMDVGEDASTEGSVEDDGKLEYKLLAVAKCIA